MNNQNDDYKKNVCMYLRKSRADVELEKKGEMETLARHEHILTRLAKEKGIHITEIKKEIETGDSIFVRPKMVELMGEVEDGKYSAVLVMNMERLSRGDMADQAMVIKTFKDSKTAIITQDNVFDLTNEMDETMTEIQTFFSRQEYKMIKARMLAGKNEAVREGNYIASKAPYGYEIKYIKRERKLEVKEDEAENVKMIFDMYIAGYGAGTIANKLNDYGYKTHDGNPFSHATIMEMIKNPVYMGKILWKRKIVTKYIDGQKMRKKVRNGREDEIIYVEGKHERIIDEQVFEKAQAIRKEKSHSPFPTSYGAANPFAGIIICPYCHRKMISKNIGGIRRLICPEPCQNMSNKFDEIEKKIIDYLYDYYENYDVNIMNADKEGQTDSSGLVKQLNEAEEMIVTLLKRREKQFDSYESGLYTDKEFKERNRLVTEKIKEQEAIRKNIKHELSFSGKHVVTEQDLLRFKHMLDGYVKSDNIEEKNKIMKQLVIKVYYNKMGRNDVDIAVFPNMNVAE